MSKVVGEPLPAFGWPAGFAVGQAAATPTGAAGCAPQPQQAAHPGLGFQQLSPGFGQPSQPAAGFEQLAQVNPAFGQPARSTPGFGQQAPQPNPGFGHPTARFGELAQLTPGFGQPAQQTPGFGQPTQPAPAEGVFAANVQPVGFGTQAQSHQQPSHSFTFAQPNQQQQVCPSSFTFGQQGQQLPLSPGGFPFGQQQQSGVQAASQQTPATRFTFGQQPLPKAQQMPAVLASALLPTPQVLQPGATGGNGTGNSGGGKFIFGLARRKKQQGWHSPSSFSGEDEGEEIVEATLAAAKAAALASIPEFQGSVSGRTKPAIKTAMPPPPPPSRALHRGATAAVAADLDAKEAARRAQRASRFAPHPTIAAAGLSGVQERLPSAAVRMGTAAAGTGSMTDGMTDGSDTVEGEGDNAEDEGGVRAGAIVGTCEEMCPAAERERRSRLSDIQIFERPDPANSAMTSTELAVKRFARTIDDSNNAPKFFRTRGALQRTMMHLRNLLDRQDARLGLIHKFLWDRYRSVRQDLYIQGMDDEFSVGIYEEVVRFHLLSEHELCEEEASITEMEGFNSHLNMEQLNKALISLNDMYNKLAAAGRPAKHEAEFRAYHLLSLMGQHGKFKGDQQAFLSMLQAMRPEVRTAPPVQWVLKLQRAFAAGNFVRFFGLVRQAPYLLACLSHIYFGQVRGCALRMLGDTLTPKADKPAIVELSWLVDALMLDSTEEAQQVCCMHGYGTSIQGGVLMALLVKGGYVEPPPPVPRKRSALITRMAPTTRSQAVTTPAVPPLSAEEAALLEQQRQEQAQRLREEEAQRAAQAAEQQCQQQAAAAAVAENQRREAEAAWLAEQARLHEQELAWQREVQRAEQQRRQAAILQQQEEDRRRLQQLASLQRQQEEQRAEAERQEAEEAARRRREAAEAAEHRRLAELERQRLEELHRQEEERRTRREAEHRCAIQTLYLARWRQEARRRVEERKRQERLALNLKACRVGMPSKVAHAGAAVAAEVEELQLDACDQAALHSNSGQPYASVPTAPARTAVDVPALAAPLLLQRSSAARALYWKLLLAPPVWAACNSGQHEQQQLQHLHSWLALQLQRGRPVEMGALGSTFVEGPLPLHSSAGSSGFTSAGELTVCLTRPGSSRNSSIGQAVLAGTSAVVLAVPGSSSSSSMTANSLGLQQRLASLGSKAAPVPTLLVAANDATAQQWRKALCAGCLSLPGPAFVINVQEAAAAAGNGPNQTGAYGSGRPGGMLSSSAPAAYSRQQLVQGLRWLAANAPPQPVLKILPTEEVVRDALVATSTPVLRSPAAAYGGLPAAQLLCSALQEALELVLQAAERACSSAAAAWQWPPPEVAPPPLRNWHSGSALPALKSALQRVWTEPADLLRMAEGRTLQALRVAVHLRLAALEADRLPTLVLPLEVEKWLEQQLDAAKTAHAPALPNAVLAAARRQQQQQQRAGSPSLRQKRKWQPGDSPPDAKPGAPGSAAAGVAAISSRSWAAVVAGGPIQLAAVAQEPQQAAPAITRVPFWHHLKQQLEAEQQRELGMQEHGVLAVTGSRALPGGQLPALIGSGCSNSLAARAPAVSDGPGYELPLLQRLQLEAMEERAAMEQLVKLAV